jgi:hypothetical protein
MAVLMQDGPMEPQLPFMESGVIYYKKKFHHCKEISMVSFESRDASSVQIIEINETHFQGASQLADRQIEDPRQLAAGKSDPVVCCIKIKCNRSSRFFFFLFWYFFLSSFCGFMWISG